MKGVCCAVRTGSLNEAACASSLKGYNYIPRIMRVIHLIQTKCTFIHPQLQSVTILCVRFSLRKYSGCLLTARAFSWNCMNNLVTAVDKSVVWYTKEATNNEEATGCAIYSSHTWTESVCEQCADSSSWCWAGCSLGRGNNRSSIRKCVMEIPL